MKSGPCECGVFQLQPNKTDSIVDSFRRRICKSVSGQFSWPYQRLKSGVGSPYDSITHTNTSWYTNHTHDNGVLHFHTWRSLNSHSSLCPSTDPTQKTVTQVHVTNAQVCTFIFALGMTWSCSSSWNDQKWLKPHSMHPQAFDKEGKIDGAKRKKKSQVKHPQVKLSLMCGIEFASQSRQEDGVSDDWCKMPSCQWADMKNVS